MMTKQYLHSVIHAFVASILIVTTLALSYFIIEPQVGRAQDTSGPFTITQEITGGTANGSTTVAVRTNSPTGYTMDIAFFNNGTANAMLGASTDSESIHDYPAVGGEPTFAFSTASTSSVFSYTVIAVFSADLDQSFLDSGAACNTGSGYTADRCWMEPRTTNFQIISRDTDATTGATSTLHFRVHVPNNPTPGVVVDMYIATATLTVAPQ